MEAYPLFGHCDISILSMLDRSLRNEMPAFAPGDAYFDTRSKNSACWISTKHAIGDSERETNQIPFANHRWGVVNAPSQWSSNDVEYVWNSRYLHWYLISSGQSFNHPPKQTENGAEKSEYSP
jgi:hypothetical protein